MTLVPSASETRRRPPPKTTLFCPDCAREAPADEGWRVADRDGREALVCPDCEAVLTVRSRCEPLTA